MKRILIFSLAYYPHVGGAEVAIKEITDRIADIEFHMITMRFSPSEPREERIGNILVHRVGGRVSYLSKILFIPRAVRMALKLDARRFDALWAMMSYMTLPIVLLRGLGVRVPYILTLQEGDPFEHVFERWHIRLFSPLLHSGFRHASVIQAISTYLGGWAREQGFTGPLEIIPNGVDIQRFFTPSGDASSSIRKRLKIHEDETVLITTSRLVPKNAIDDVIQALPLLPASVHFLILGVGFEEGKLKRLAKECAVAQRVQFLGHLSHEEMPAYLAISNIFVRPSRSEGMGNAFVEAMAAGVPVIGTQEGGIVDFLFDAKRNSGKEPTGFAVDKNSPAQIAETVEEIVRNPEATKKVIEHARRLVLEKYDWNIIAHNMRRAVFGAVLQTS